MQNPDVKLLEPVLACPEAEVPRNGAILTRVIKGRTIALARGAPNESTIVAFESRCPHMQGPLRLGRVVDGEVVCPWHFLRFNTATGATVGCDSIMRLETFPVELMNGNVYVQVAGTGG